MNQTNKSAPFPLAPVSKGSLQLPGLARWAVKLAIIACVIAGALGWAQQLQAQTARFRSPTFRATIQAGGGTFTFTNLVSLSGTGATPVDLTISGLPSGASYTIASTTGPLTLDGGLPSVTATTPLLISVTTDGTVPQGLYTATLSASSGAVNTWQFYLQVAKFWNGTDASSGANTNWNDGANWVGGSAPGANDDVIFGNQGATNAANVTNVMITASTAVASVRFAQTNGTMKFYTVAVNPGVTLSVLGTNGFSALRDSLNIFNNGTAGQTISFVNGGTLIVSNEAVPFVDMVDNQTACTLDFSQLNYFYGDVSQVLIGDCVQAPFYRNYNDANAYGAQPRSALMTFNLARTNLFRAIYVDPNNYTNSDNRHWGFSFMNSELSGSSTAPIINLGISNAFYADSVDFIGGNSRGTVQFNSIYTASNPIALFRNTNGGRMTLYSQSDGGGTNTANSNVKSTIDFRGGNLDMLADRFIIGRDRVKIQSASTPNYQGTFFMGRGVLDANTMIFGFREHPGEATNANYAYLGYCEGQFTVSNGVVHVNNSLTLGYTTESNPNGLGVATPGNSEYGQVSIWNGASFNANNVFVGGPVYNASRNNFLFVSNSASLSVSNYIGGPNQMLDFITLAGGSQLVLSLNSTSLVAAVYATNYNVIGSNSFILSGIKNAGSLVNGQVIPLFKRGAGGAPSLTFINQSGVNGQIVNDTDAGGSDANLQDFQVILSSPKTLLWKGYSSANWDNATANWLDLNTGLQTNFVAGDKVAFDDSASQFGVNLVSGATLLPGAINMTNVSHGYIFNNAGGSIIGGSTLAKTGAAGLEIDAPTSVAVALTGGTLTGSGSIGSVTIASGATMYFSGSISGDLTCAGVGTALGTVNGTLSVQSGGLVTNAGTMNGPFTVNGTLVNNPGATFPSFGVSSSVPAGGTLVNRGGLTGVNLTIGGTFKDTGEGSSTLTGTFTANSGAVIIPGGDGVGTTTINPGSASGFPGRVLLSGGSTNILKVNIVGTVNTGNTMLLSGYQDYGGSASARTQNGCTLVITNVGSGQFTLGQTFTFFQEALGGNPVSTGAATNTYPVIVPATPGPGMIWDLTQLWPLGVIGVVTNVGPVVHATFAIQDVTNIISTFDWTGLKGYSLENLSAPNTNGMVVNTNYSWTRISGSWTNDPSVNQFLMVTNVLGTNNGNAGVYYRISFP